MSVSVRKLLSVCARTSLVAAIASTAALPLVASAEERAGTTPQAQVQPQKCREPLLDETGRPLPGNVNRKGGPPPCRREHKVPAGAPTR